MSIDQAEQGGTREIQPENIPEELRSERAWVLWRFEPGPRDGKPTKVPYQASGHRASSTDPSTWTTFEAARAALERDRNFHGVGFVFHDNNPYAGVDLDDMTEEQAGRWLDLFDSYAERSPSGDGVHIICKAELPQGTKKSAGELYSSGRFFTMTGNVIRDAPIRAAQEAAEEFYEYLRAGDAPATSSTPSSTRAATPAMSDDEVIRRAEAARDGGKFRDVYAGSLDYHPGKSERDASLAWLLAFWTQDPEQIERIMHGSGCDRPKWNERRGTTTWVGQEIGRAIDGRTETYAGTASLSANGSANGAGRTRENAPRVTNTLNTSNTFSRSTRMDAAPIAFPVDALPEPAARYVEEAAASLSCPPELVALPVLAAISGVMGQSRRLRIKPGWTESGLLWAAVVDTPGGRKSPAAGFAYKAVEKIQAMLRKAHKAERETYAKEMRQHALDKKLAARDDKPEPEPPVPPTMNRVIVDDITAEAVAMRLEENPRGLLQAQDELTGFLRGLDQYKSGGKGNARQLYLKIWSSRTIIVDRKGSDEPLAVPQPYVTLQGGIQPAVLHEIAGGRDDGFLDRFLFGYPEPHRGGYSDESISHAAEAAYENLIGRIWDLQPEETDDDEVRPRIVRMTPDAKEMFKAAANSVEAEKFRPGFPEILQGPWSKFDTHLARLALIIGVANSAVEGNAVERVTAEDMQAALRLVDYFKATTRKVYEQLFEANPDDVLAANLVTLLTESGYKFFGTTSLLLDLLDPEIRPSTPDALGKAVRRIAKKSPALTVEPHHDGKERKILITLEKVLEVLEVLGENGHAPPTEIDSQTHTHDDDCMCDECLPI